MHLLHYFSRCFYYALALLTILPARAAGSEFFRILSWDQEQTIAHLSNSAFLIWSNSAPGSRFLVERTHSLSSLEWQPVARGHTGSNNVVSIKVAEPFPPTGFAFIPGGLFKMGDILGDHNNATPVHPVTLKPFFMKKHEIRNIELAAVFQWAFENNLIQVSSNTVLLRSGDTNVLMDLKRFAQEISFSSNGFSVKTGREEHPAAYISWYGAVAYCNFLSSVEGKEVCYNLQGWSCDFTKTGYRLPTEAEWELAARGGYEGKRFPWHDSDLITHSRANYKSETNNVYDVSPTRGFHPDYAGSNPRSSPVGTFPPNNYGLYDMCGNVWEWVWDWSGRYLSGHQTNPIGPVSGRFRVFRGGSWYTTAERVTVAMRYSSAAPDRRIEDVGFRPVLPLTTEAP